MWLTHIHVRYDLQTFVGRNCIAAYAVFFSWFDTDCTVSEMTYTMSSGMLNPGIPYLTVCTGSQMTACDHDNSDLDVVPGGWIIPAQQVTQSIN